MLRRNVGALMIAAVFALVGGFVTPQAATADARPAVVTISYDDSQAPEYTDEITEAIAIWNDKLSNVQIDQAAPGAPAEVTFISDSGWPRAELGPAMPGDRLRIWMGKQAVDDGHNVIRIAAHEFGHSLGLPDVKPGPCSSLMSGSTAGVGCTNAVPNAQEIAEAESNYQTKRAPRKGAPVVVVD